MKRRQAIEQIILGGSLASLAPLSASQQEADTLNIDDYVLTFDESFEQPLDVSAWGPSRWIAHTPWHGDFGDATFVDPQEDFPFRQRSGLLEIIAARRGGINARWQSGLLASQDPQGRGFSQAEGYFESRMKLPKGPGVWPAFWLATLSDVYRPIEVDVMEYYGHDPEHYHVNVHVWPKRGFGQHAVRSSQIAVSKASLSTEFHTYGVDIHENRLTFYLDRRVVWQTMAPENMRRQEMMILADLALGSGWPIDQTPDPSVLAVTYIRAFKRK